MVFTSKFLDVGALNNNVQFRYMLSYTQKIWKILIY